MRRLRLDGQEYVLPAAGAYSLLGTAEPDEVLAALRAAGLAPAWLSAQGGLISNLSLLDNLLLPRRWQGQDEPAALERDVLAAVQLLGLEPAPTVLALRQRPAQSSPEAQRLAVCLRVLVQRPSLLVLEAGALHGQWQDEPWHACWSRWLPQALLLSLDKQAIWPVLAPARSAFEEEHESFA